MDDTKALNIQVIIDLLQKGDLQGASDELARLGGEAKTAGEAGAEGAHKSEISHRNLAVIIQKLAGEQFPELGHSISHLAFGGTVVGSIFAVIGLIELLKRGIEGYQEKLHEIEEEGSKAIFLQGIEEKLAILREVKDALADYQDDIEQEKDKEHSVTSELAHQLDLHAAIRAAQQSQLEAEHTLKLAKLETDKALGNITPAEAAIQKGEIEKKYAEDKAKAERDAINQQVQDQDAAAADARDRQAGLDSAYEEALKKVSDEKARQAGINDRLAEFDEKKVAGLRASSEGKTPDEWRQAIATLQDSLKAAQSNTEVDSSALQASLGRYITNDQRYLQSAIELDRFQKLQAQKTEIARADPLPGLEKSAATAKAEAADNAKAAIDADKKSKDLVETYNATLDARNKALSDNIAAIDANTIAELSHGTGVGPGAATQDRAARQQNLLSLAYAADVIAAGEAAQKNIREGRVNESLNPEAFRKNQQAIAAEDAIPQSQKDLVQALDTFSTGHQRTMQQAAEAIGKLNDTPTAFVAVLQKLVAKTESNDQIAKNLLERLTHLESQISKRD